MTDLTQQVVHREGTMEFFTTNEIRFNHRGDKVTLRGPLHAMVRYVRDDGKEKASEELVLKTPNDTRTIENQEHGDDRYDVHITDMGPLPTSGTMLDLVVDKKHLEVASSTMFVGKHKNDMVRLRGPARLRVEYKDKHGKVVQAEDAMLGSPNDIRDFVLHKEDWDMYVSGAYMGGGAPSPAQSYAPPPQPAPAYTPPSPPVHQPPPPPAPPAPMGFLGLPEGTLIRAHNGSAVYVIEGGRKRHITSPAVAQKYGYNLGTVKLFSEIEVNAVPTGDPKS